MKRGEGISCGVELEEIKGRERERAIVGDGVWKGRGRGSVDGMG